MSVVIADDDYKKETRGRRGNTSSRSKIRTEQSVTSNLKSRAGEGHVVDTHSMSYVIRNLDPGYLTSSGTK
jgi:phage terminase Nu1 subunit (DNA packaging protein)